jgi:hypothetical protein
MSKKIVKEEFKEEVKKAEKEEAEERSLAVVERTLATMEKNLDIQENEGGSVYTIPIPARLLNSVEITIDNFDYDEVVKDLRSSIRSSEDLAHMSSLVTIATAKKIWCVDNIINQLPEYTIKQLCIDAEVPRSTYYKYRDKVQELIDSGKDLDAIPDTMPVNEALRIESTSIKNKFEAYKRVAAEYQMAYEESEIERERQARDALNKQKKALATQKAKYEKLLEQAKSINPTKEEREELEAQIVAIREQKENLETEINSINTKLERYSNTKSFIALVDDMARISRDIIAIHEAMPFHIKRKKEAE